MRWSTASVLVLALGLSGIGGPRPDADAAVVCQRGNKIKLRAEACKQRETKLFDTGEVGVERERVTGHDARLDEHETRLDAGEGRLDDDEQRLGDTEAALVQHCEGDPTRRPVVFTRVGFSLAPCRMLDADPQACGQAFQLGLFGFSESCVHLQGNCIGCALQLEVAGLCQNTCESFSCVDTTRTNAGSCVNLSENECNMSFGLTFAFPTPENRTQTTSCFWNEDEFDCENCDPAVISQGLCQNTCLTPDQFPRCRAAGRTYGDCGQLDGNEVRCNATYQFTERGTATCWYDAGVCEPCEPANEGEGKCSNDC
jgi:hypothetical protein